MWGGDQKVSRPIDRCQAMSQCAPNATVNDAASAHQRYQGIGRARSAAAVVVVMGVAAAVVTLMVPKASTRPSRDHVEAGVEPGIPRMIRRPWNSIDNVIIGNIIDNTIGSASRWAIRPGSDPRSWSARWPRGPRST